MVSCCKILNFVQYPVDMISHKRLIIVLVLFAVTFLFVQSTNSVQEVAIKKPLNTFPDKIGEYELIHSTKLIDSVVSVLQVDDYINYNYRTPNGLKINFYVSYFSAVGIKGGYHSPRNCIPGGGWGIAAIEPFGLDINRSKPGKVNINAMTIQRGEEEQIVLYWYQNRGRIITSEYWEKIYLVWDALTKRRRDGSFIRVMAYIPKGRKDEVMRHLKDFSEQAMSLLDDYLPGEKI